MNKKELFSVALKFTSLLLLLSCLQNVILLVLELTLPAAKQLSLFGLSPFGSIVRFFSIILYGLSGYFLFKKSDPISLILIKDNKNEIASRSAILQMVVAYQGSAGIIYSLIDLILSLINIFPILDISSLDNLMGKLVTKLGVDFVTFTISLILLLNYEKITRFLLRLIPHYFWGE